MNTQQQNEEIFDHYLSGKMGKESAQAFEAQLAADSELNAAFLLHRQVVNQIEIAALKKKLNLIHDEATAKQTATKKTIAFPSFKWVQGIAAAIAIILVGIGTYRYASNNKEAQLYAKYYSQDAGLPSLMGESGRYNFDDAMVDYKTGAYSKAISKLEAINKNNMGNDTVNYYLAMSFMAYKDYDNALHILSTLESEQNPFHQKALWYKALAQLKVGQKKEAVTSFIRIAESPSSTYAQSAKEILQALKKK